MGDAKAGSRSTRAGTKRAGIRRRAVGTRDRIVAHLAADGEIGDPAGMASTRLADAVGYPGSSVAFAQLLSGMERDGLIVREIRGKRTYRISLPDGGVPAAGAAGEVGYPSVPSGGLPAVTHGGALAAPAGFDYDELARRLLVQVVRRLATTSIADAVDSLATVDVPGAVAETAEGRDHRHHEHGPSDERAPGESGEPGESDDERAALQQTVAGLERELATAWSRHGTLTAENAKLREQLRETQRDLARERTRRAQITSELNQSEVVLLDHLLSTTPDGGDSQPDAAAN